MLSHGIELSRNLNLTLVDVPPETAFGQVLDRAREHRLTVYDAAYLELAMREGLALATQGADLIAAAKRVGLPELD